MAVPWKEETRWRPAGSPARNARGRCSRRESRWSSAISVQPYVESATVRVDRSVFTEGGDRYSYVSLTGDMIDAVVTIRIGDSKVTAEMRYDRELGYPLMYVSDIC